MMDVLKSLSVSLLMFPLLANVASAADKPNVLFLAVDDMNDWIGCLKTTPRAITPNIDKLASRGISFSNAHTAGVYCAPSRAAIFTGQFASTTGCYRNQIYFVNHPKLQPLHCSMHGAGYATFGAGKLFHHPAGQIDMRGWTEFFVRRQQQRETGWPMDSWSEETPIPQPYPNSIYNRGGQPANGFFLEWGKVPNDKEVEMADTLRTEWAISKLKVNHDAPFFLALGLYTPHFPNYCPKKYFDLYDRDKIELPPYKADDLDDLPEKIRTMKFHRSKIHQKLERLDAVKDAIHGYLACMSYADAMIGRVLDTLAAGPYADNTIVVLWSDHGYHHGEKGDWGKHTLWERTSNVPFVWAGPGIARGKAVDTTVSLIDLYPTFVEMCGLPKPDHALEGRSLAGTLKNPDQATDRDVYLPFMVPGAYAIINRNWRYIHYADNTEELYDVQADPNEWTNLAGNPKFDATKIRLRKSAPKTFAEPGPLLNRRRHLVLDGESFHWDADRKPTD
ncbi:MAG: sulfatase [Candidatus Nealsonbacteria bacterium]|nr:sulfatase [Candidatus Nealsonbacteria bacterium]